MTVARPAPAANAGGWPTPTVALVGPTASGKSQVALEAATAMSARGPAPVELVSVDSMAVYRGMDIGTAKPTPEDRATVPYHLVDLVDAGEDFTVQQFQAAGRGALADIAARCRGALLVGGTGLYLRSLIDDLQFPGRFPAVAASLEEELDDAGPDGSPARQAALEELHHQLARFDPVAAGRIGPANRRRLVRALEVTIGAGRPFSSFGPGLERYPATPVTLVGLGYDPSELDRRIDQRFHRLLDRGLLDEVRTLAARPGGWSRTARQALGYRELLSHIEGGLPLSEAVDLAVRRTRTLARRQMAWFRRDPRIVWLHPGDDPVGSLVARLASAPRAPDPVGDWSGAP